MRGQNLGSQWLEAIKKQLPNQKFWLLIEDEHLHHFYIKNGFERIQNFQNGDVTEGLYVYNGS
jgi:diamine N-acetyltransferase